MHISSFEGRHSSNQEWQWKTVRRPLESSTRRTMNRVEAQDQSKERIYIPVRYKHKCIRIDYAFFKPKRLQMHLVVRWY
jgi:hypothetical protein